METVRIRYVGGSLGRTIWRGPVTGAAYMFSGAKRDQVVDARDAAALVKLEERGKRLFRWASTLPLRIGWVVPTVGCFGSVREMVEVSNALAGRGHQVTIYSPDGGPVVWLPCRTSYGNLEAARRAELDVLLGIVDWQPELYRVLVESRAKRRGVCLMGVHPSAELIAVLRGELPTEDPAWQVLRAAVQDPDMLILADGAFQLEWLHAATGREVGVRFGGVNTGMFHPAEGARPEGPLRIGYAGDPRPRKGTDTVEAALEIVRGRYPEVVVRSYWGQRLDQAGLVRWYQDTDIFLDGHRRGGWCNPVAEALACGCAVVCTRIGATAELAIDGKTALTVEVDDIEGMAAAACELIERDSLRATLRGAALAQVAQYSYERIGAQMEAYLRKVVR